MPWVRLVDERSDAGEMLRMEFRLASTIEPKE